MISVSRRKLLSAMAIASIGREKLSVELRGEMFNLLNHANLMNVDSNLAD